MTRRLTVFACGNTSRGDDALGVLLLERVEKAQFPDVTTIEDFQFQIEHSLDLDHADLALFLDAATDALAPIAFFEVEASTRITSASTHALEPADLLAVYRKVMGKAPPPTFVLGVRGQDFSIREGLSEPARERLEKAWLLVRDLCMQPDAKRWRGLAQRFSTAES